jgi:hypothetical protein
VFQLDPTLPEPLYPLAWLVGTWTGVGVVDFPTMTETRFAQEVEFAHDGRKFLEYRSRTWLLGEAGRRIRPLACETGYWRPSGPAEDGGTELEVLLTHPTGYVEIYVGSVDGPRVQLSTDLVARTATAKDYSAATRRYGLVEGELLWVMDMAAMDHSLTSHASAQLIRSS